MIERPKLTIKQADLVYSASLVEPSLRLLPNNIPLVEGVLEALKPFGAQLDNLSTSISADFPSRSSFSIDFLGGFATARISPGGLEITFRGPGESQPIVPFLLPAHELGRILSDAVRAVLENARDPRLSNKEHSFRLDTHGQLEGAQPMDLLSALIKRPLLPSLPAESLGIRYGFGPEGDRLRSWLVLEPSVRIIPGLFVSGAVVFEGSLNPASAAEKLREYLRSLTESPEFPVTVTNE